MTCCAVESSSQPSRLSCSGKTEDSTVANTRQFDDDTTYTQTMRLDGRWMRVCRCTQDSRGMSKA